ncbi:hypothetical protein [Maribellus maritimus]|uniref:hypothetical protein n=1 Tax=Maribellus maritimus TaxID=2870838 RepID=UPI001EEB08B0|nr:hypothetical protein [Maribellus maritimus]MCG6188322.1 hypothetical protein [Maribellus maritimus]
MDEEGKEFEVEYQTVPDGQRKKYENPQVADEVMSEFESEFILNSYTFKGEKVIAFASRIIESEVKMKVIQRFFTAEGKHFDNIQYYQKAAL